MKQKDAHTCIPRKYIEPQNMENREEKVRENIWDLERGRWANQREIKPDGSKRGMVLYLNILNIQIFKSCSLLL